MATQSKNQLLVMGAGGGCFRAGSQVQLEGGKTIAIEKLKVGDEVLSFDERGNICKSKVTKVHYHDDPQPILHVKFWRGEIFATPNHWVLNQYDAFAELGRLSTEDALVDGMGHLRPIISAEIVGHEPVYNLTVEPNHTFICNNVRVHNGGHRDRFPTVQGAGGGGKGKGRAPVEADDTLQSRAMISVLDLLGEGEIGGLVNGARSIFIEDTPLQNPDGTMNFNGVSWVQTTGTQNQQPIAGFSDIETPYPVQSRVRKDTPRTITITNPNADQVRMIVTLPALHITDKKTGDVHGTVVQIQFEIATIVNGVEGPFVDVSGQLTLRGKSRSRYQRAYTLTLPKPGEAWKVRMKRLTDDSASMTLANETWLDSYVEVVNARLTYPNSALVGVRIDSEHFNSVPNRSYLVRGLYIRVPSNYDPNTRTYSGIWNGTFKPAISDNPAWVLFDILTNKRYGLGQYLTDNQIDTAALYRIGRYCDELVPDGYGGWEPRFTCNTVINSQQEAFKVISDLTSVFRGMAYWTGGMVGFTQDAPTTPSMIFNQANVVDGIFTYSGSSRKDRHSVALITWNDPKEQYKQKIEYVESPELVAKYGIRKIDMVAFGCTSRGQAHRAGLWMLYTEQFESDLISFKVGLDAALVLPGEVVKIHDQFRAGKRMGGRLAAATTTSATLDAPIRLDSPNAIISVRLPDGSFADRTVLQGTGTHEVLTWTTPLPAVPLVNSMWLVAEPVLEPILARVVGVQQGDSPTEFIITALEHNPDKFDAIERGLKLEEPKTSIIDPSKVDAPQDLKVTETLYEVAPGVIGTKLHVSWYGTATSYELRWRRRGKYATNWESITTTSSSIELENVRKSVHEFEIVAVNNFGRRSTPAVTISHKVVGKTTAPGDVLNFKVERRTTDLLITWDPVKDIEAPTYEVRVGPSWDEAQVITTAFNGTMVRHDQDDAGTYFYHIRSFDRAGNASDNVTTFKLILDPPAPVVDFDCVQSGNRLEFRWKPNQEVGIVGYEIREGGSWTTSILVAQVNATSFSMPAGASGDRTFWIKAIASPGIYGREAVFTSTNIAQPSNVNILTVIDERANAWGGAAHHLEPAAGDLVMVNGVQKAEYVFGVDLGDRYRAQNSLFGTIDSLSAEANMTWADATFAWDAAQANRAWTPSGSAMSVSGRFQIAPYTGMTEGEVDGFRLDGDLVSVKYANPTQSAGVTYGEGRYGRGVLVKDTTSVAWGVAVPSLFATSFWINVREVTDCVYWTATGIGDGSGIRLSVGYSKGRGGFFVEDQLGRRVDLPFALAAGDVVCIGLAQEPYQRRLMACKLHGTAVEAVGTNMPEQGIYSQLRLY